MKHIKKKKNGVNEEFRKLLEAEFIPDLYQPPYMHYSSPVENEELWMMVLMHHAYIEYGARMYQKGLAEGKKLAVVRLEPSRAI